LPTRTPNEFSAVNTTSITIATSCCVDKLVA
jgi:hypothetical protein